MTDSVLSLLTTANLQLKEDDMKYGLAWMVGIPLPLIALWFLVNHSGCGH